MYYLYYYFFLFGYQISHDHLRRDFQDSMPNDRDYITSMFCDCVQNPYVLSADPCGSSSGSAISVAANLVTVSLGTETDGSIICPSNSNSVVGIKPTIGLTSRAGVIPVSPRQDTVG